MDKYEYNVRLEQITKLAAKKDYKTAARISDSIDWRRVKSVGTLTMIGEVYEGAKRYEDARDILLMAYERAPIGRRIAYRLTEVCIKGNDFKGAKKYYEDFVNLSPNDNRKYELLYEIYRKQGVPVTRRITILEEYTKGNVDEYWSYELACCYYEAGLNDKCVRQCDELFLWFGDGEYVVKALELKAIITSLTDKQEAVFWAAVNAANDEPKAAEAEVNTEESTEAGSSVADDTSEVEDTASKASVVTAAATVTEAVLTAEEKEAIKSVYTREPVPKKKTGNKRKRRAAKKNVSKPAVKSIEEQLEEREQNRINADDKKIVLEPVKSELVFEEIKGEPLSYDPDDQIEGQVTIEEFFASLDEEADKPENEQPVDMELAFFEEPRLVPVNITVDEEEFFIEEVEKSEKIQVDEETFWKEEVDKATDMFNTAEMSEIADAVVRMTDEMIEESGEDIYSEAELTNEQKETFSQFLYMRGMDEQLANIFQAVAESKPDIHRSADGNIMIVGDYKSGKTTLAISVIKEINAIRRRYNRRIAKISGERLNNKGIRETFSQLNDADILIEHAGRMSKATMQGLFKFMSGETGGMLVVFEDTKEGMEYIISQVPEARTYFSYYIELREIEIADWVNVAKKYCKENGFIIDDMAKLALSAKISQISKEDFAIEYEDIKKISDDAIKRYKRRHFLKRKTGENGMAMLKEIDFK